MNAILHFETLSTSRVKDMLIFFADLCHRTGKHNRFNILPTTASSINYESRIKNKLKKNLCGIQTQISICPSQISSEEKNHNIQLIWSPSSDTLLCRSLSLYEQSRGHILLTQKCAIQYFAHIINNDL